MVERYIKSACEELMKRYSDVITTDFDINKEIVEQFTEVKSKKLRNKIAGRLVVEKKNENRVIVPPRNIKAIRNKRRKEKKRK